MDLVEARRLFRLTVEQGQTAAQCHLGIMNLKGEGGPVDLVEARRLLRLAAEQSRNARSPMCVTEAGRWSEVSLEDQNAASPMCVTKDGNSSEVSFEQ